jgi:hypothetical protein
MNINVRQAYNKIVSNVNNSKFKLIDVRSPFENQQAKIKNSILIPLN